ncbi:MAG: helix-turn-helix domain-containing protein, partial [Spongiibacteraceae bacterium]|nr:helix-turn-helix domain-containing protein [Spongiibacteraceae bacterium]
MVNEPIPGADTASPDDSPGARLRRAREAAGLSQDDVMEALRLLRFQVVALESDRYDQMAGSTFVRGYLRAYARLLQLPEGPLLEAFETLQRQQTPPASNLRKAARRRISGPRRALLGLVAALLAWGVINWLTSAPATPVDAAVVVDEPALSIEPGQSAGPGEYDQQGPEGPAAGSDSSELPAEQVLDDNGLTEYAPSVPPGLLSLAALDGSGAEPRETGLGSEDMALPSPVPAGASGAPPAAAAAGGRQLRFSADCWGEVREASGTS